MFVEKKKKKKKKKNNNNNNNNNYNYNNNYDLINDKKKRTPVTSYIERALFLVIAAVCEPLT